MELDDPFLQLSDLEDDYADMMLEEESSSNESPVDVTNHEQVLDTCALLHSKMHRHWQNEIDSYKARFGKIKTRAERAIEAAAHRGGIKGRSRGDLIVDSIRHLFHTGMGIKWSEVQVKIFNVFLDTCLPKIYGNTWAEHKARVLRERKLKRVWQEALINMARRNGKTFVTSGTAAVLLLCVPDISIAIFSTGERTARMLMDVVRKMIRGAWLDGSVVKESDYNIVQSNKEVLLLEGPDGTKRLLGCYPGSVRVSWFFFYIQSLAA